MNAEVEQTTKTPDASRYHVSRLSQMGRSIKRFIVRLWLVLLNLVEKIFKNQQRTVVKLILANDLEELRAYVSMHRINLNFKLDNRDTLLHLVAQTGNTEIVDLTDEVPDL